MQKKNLLAGFILFILIFIIGFANYQPNTFLTGWDNLHPEFNFGLNIKRSLNAVWQEYQGLGLLGGMGHASDLPRELLLLLGSLFLPTSFLRYFYTFLMLFIGPLGIYFLLNYLTNKKIISFLGALFYLFNLATVQTFYVPFSAFTAHYAFLPWLIYLFIRYLKKPTRKNLFGLFIINVLAIPQAYVPTVFLVYLMTIFPFIVFRWLSKQDKLRTFKTSVKSLLIIFCVNAFWLLPFLCFTLTKSSVVVESKINQMISEEVFIRNKAFGGLKDVVLLKGFWFDNRVLEETGSFTYMLEPWMDHLENPLIETVGYLFFAVIILGAFYSLKEKKHWFYQSFLFLFIFSFTMLATAALPFSWFNAVLRKLVPLFAQVFRFPYTKFSILALFCYTIFFSLGLEFIFSIFFKLRKRLSLLLAGFCLILLTTLGWPFFKGSLIYKRTRLKIPPEYFALFDFFKEKDPATRIANFPQAWHWGWSNYKWGYTGSGFLWYGIEQPILDRAFDVWSEEDEGYYWEISQAVSSHNLSLLEKVLEKYQINWLLIDENIYATGPSRALQIENLKEMLNESKMISLVKSFGRIKVYQVDLPINEEKFVFFVENPLKVEPSYKWANTDQAFVENGIYYSSSVNNQQSTINNLYYPFRELFTKNSVQNKNWQVETQSETISFQTKLPPDQQWTEEDLNLDSLEKKQSILLYRNALEKYRLSPKVFIKNDSLEVQIAKYDLIKPDEIDFRQKIGKKETCNPFKKGEYNLEIIEEEKRFLRLWSQGASSCTAFNFPYLEHDYSYLLEIESRNIQGKDLLFYVVNETTKKAVLEILLPKSKNWSKNHYVLPPGNFYGKGYSLHFDNVSLGNEKVINDLGDIKIYPIPFNFLKELEFINKTKNEPMSSPSSINFSVEKKNPSFYKVTINEQELKVDGLTLVLSQSFDSGWKAFYFEGLKPVVLKNHVLVNNWANGWEINLKTQSSNVKTTTKNLKLYIFFWPQIFQYLGFIMMIGYFVWLVKLKKD